MEYQISRATRNDLPLMQRLFFQTVTFFGSHMLFTEDIKIYSQLSRDKELASKRITEDFVYNAKLNGEIIGSFMLRKDGTLDYIFVHKSYQGKGIARRLYKKIEEIAKDNGMTTLTTLVTTNTESFFKKLGFEIIKNIEKVVGGDEVICYNGIKNL